MILKKTQFLKSVFENTFTTLNRSIFRFISVTHKVDLFKIKLLIYDSFLILILY